MSQQAIKKYSDLKKRIGKFLKCNAGQHDEIRSFLDSIKSLGDVVIIGGMLRDLSISGREGFHSDIDLVIHASDKEKLEYAFSKYEWTKNKFGGYRINTGRWPIDLWTFDSTWAFKEGYVKGEDFKDLCKTTFFNWDAIVFELYSGQLHAADDYIKLINEKKLDINLQPNPNPLGNVIKIFRYYEKYGAVLSPRLVEYANSILKDLSYNDILAYERKSYEKNTVLDTFRFQYIYKQMISHQKEMPRFPFNQVYSQAKLEFEPTN